MSDSKHVARRGRGGQMAERAKRREGLCASKYNSSIVKWVYVCAAVPSQRSLASGLGQ